jgi:SAM-dependent methyltransferase
MYADANEQFFAQLYLTRIRHHAQALGIRPPAAVLEAGCQAGRLVVPLALEGFRVTGIDTSGFALRRAQAHAKRAGTSAELIRGDLTSVLRAPPQRQFDIVICAEVLYLRQEYREMLAVLADAVRPGGLLCVSHRPKMYYLIEALKRYDMRAADVALQRSEGGWGDAAYYNWQTPQELRALYERVGVRWLAAYPIDQFGWLAGVSPEKLTHAQQRQLMALETGGVVAEAGWSRYVLVVAQRPADGQARHDAEERA